MKTLADKDIPKGRCLCDACGYLLDPAKLSHTVESLAEYLKFSPSVQPRLALEAKCLAQLYPILSKQLEDKELFNYLLRRNAQYVLFVWKRPGQIDMGLLKNLAKEIEKHIRSKSGCTK